MNAEDLAVDHSAQNQKVKDLAASFPDRRVAVLLLAFFVETVDLSDLSGFVVAADKGHAIWISRAT